MGRIQQKKEIKICPASFGEPVDTLLYALPAFGVLMSYFFVFLSSPHLQTHQDRQPFEIVPHVLPVTDGYSPVII